MPKIEVNERAFFGYIGKKMEEDELIKLLTVAKAELDGWIRDESLLKIELNDTNRPDLWSSMGLARQLRLSLGGAIPDYNFFSVKRDRMDTEDRAVQVDPALKEIRPFIAAFIAEGMPIDEPLLLDLIQSQEKLCWNYGRKRSSIAMGVYRSNLMTFPVHYRAADPDNTCFIPLDFDRELSLRQILSVHPRGVEFGAIVSDFPLFPFLEDDRAEVLSFPPIINSAHLGAVKVGDSHHFIEMTGTDLDSLLLSCSIVACDMADAGYKILPVRILYPYDTVYGKEIITPYYFQKPISLNIDYASKLLGEEIGTEVAVDSITRLGTKVQRSGKILTVTPPPYRNDFLHPVDIVEEIMIGRGLESFEPIWPQDFTIGRLSPMESFSRRVREIMVGLGYQEMIYNYLGSRKDFAQRMNRSGEDIIEIANPMSESFEAVRNSQLPNLLSSESISANAVYPHRIFEIGKTAVKDDRQNYGSRTRNVISFLISDREVGFNDVHSHLSALFFYLSLEYSLEECEDPRFIQGRAGTVFCKGEQVGIVGEIDPAVLENWGIQMPCAGAELGLDSLLEKEA